MLTFVFPEATENDQMTFAIPLDLPYLKNNRFTGREKLLNEIHHEVLDHRARNQTTTPIVLYGTGGIGKSQIAISYTYNHLDPHSAVFWINAATKESIIFGFRSAAERVIYEHAKRFQNTQPDYPFIAKKLGMIGVVDKDGSILYNNKYNKRIVDGMKLWLGQQENIKWLLVFDNVDDPEAVQIQDFIPCSTGDALIMTSRRQDCADYGKGFEVKQLLEQEGVNLLLKTARLNSAG